MSTPAIAAKLTADARMQVLVPQLTNARREMARLQAEEAELLSEARRIAEQWAHDEDPNATSAAEFPHRSVAAEIASAWHVSDRTVQRQIEEAAVLVGDYPETLAALASGEISSSHARIIVAAGSPIERPELRAEFEASVLDYAKSESASRLAPIAKRRAEWFAESTVDQRHRRARAQRRVWVTDLDDAMAEVHAIVPVVIGHGIHDRLTQLGIGVIAGRGDSADDSNGDTLENADATTLADPDERTLDELRADIFTDLLLATDPIAHNNGPTGLAAIHATVQITVPVLTLIDDGVVDPFETAALDGRSPIDIETARALTSTAPGWNRVLTHPVSGSVLTVDRYRPSEDLRRHLRVRDEHCRFPRLPHARPQVRYRPHHRSRAGRCHRRRQSRPSLSATSHSQTSDCLDRTTTFGWCARVDQPHRSHLFGCAGQHRRLRGRSRLCDRSPTVLNRPASQQPVFEQPVFEQPVFEQRVRSRRMMKTAARTAESTWARLGNSAVAA